MVLIVVDTLRKDHLSCYGYEGASTPALDRLAERSVRYERAISQAPWTTPSIGALFSSQYPTTLGIEDDRSVLSEDLTLLPEVLQAAGYRTGAVISHSFCSSQWNFDQGFEHFDETQILGTDGTSSHEISDRGMAFVEEGGEPFFLWLHYFDPHWRYVPHAGFERPPPAEPYDGPVEPRMAMRQLRTMTDRLGPADIAELERQYDEEIAYTDHHIGRFLDRLDELGLYEEAVIVFVADHGEEFKDHGQLGHAHTLHSEVIEVPLILHVPGRAPGVERAPVATVDVFPTILEAVGLRGSAGSLGLAGRSLLSPEGSELRPIFSETTRRGNLRSVVLGRWKLVRDLAGSSEHLYDLDADPAERRDVAGEHPEERARLGDYLDRWLAGLAEAGSDRERIELTAEELERLEALGYGGE